MREKYIFEVISESSDYFKCQKEEIVAFTVEFGPIIFVRILKCFSYTQIIGPTEYKLNSLWGQPRSGWVDI